MPENSSDRQSTYVQSDEDDLLIKSEEQRALLEAENGLQQFDEVLRLAEAAIPNQTLELTQDPVVEFEQSRHSKYSAISREAQEDPNRYFKYCTCASTLGRSRETCTGYVLLRERSLASLI